MKSYESLIILSPTLSESDAGALVDSIEGWINNNEGSVTLLKPWGIKELAYPINKVVQGYYVQIQFDATRKTLIELRNRIKVTETILRDLTVTMDSIQSKTAHKEELVVQE